MEINKIGRKWVVVRSMQINTCKAILRQLLLCGKLLCECANHLQSKVIVEQLLLCGQQLPEYVKLQSNSWTELLLLCGNNNKQLTLCSQKVLCEFDTLMKLSGRRRGNTIRDKKESTSIPVKHDDRFKYGITACIYRGGKNA